MSVAFVFPGQGSQAVGMLGALAAEHPVVGDTFGEASEALGRDLWALVRDGPEADLNRTELTQPVMVAAGFAVWRVWLQSGGKPPAWLAGHSLGEYTALVCAGSLGFADAVRLVAERGRLMQAAVPAGSGAMAAILGLEEAVLEAICKQAGQGEIVACANLNAPGQTVIAGHKGAVERACAAAKAAGARRAVPLPVSVPSHCALMQPAAAGFAAVLDGVALHPPALAVVHNVDVATHADAAGIRAALVSQLSSPVRWIETTHRLAAAGVTTIVECGPGKVLTGLCKRIETNMNCLAVSDPASLQAALSDTRGT